MTSTTTITTTKTAGIWLLIWTINNIAVTVINKATFSFIHFPYPYTLSAIHMICSYIGCCIIFYFHDYYYSNSNNVIVVSKLSKSTKSTSNNKLNNNKNKNNETRSILNGNDDDDDDDNDINYDDDDDNDDNNSKYSDNNDRTRSITRNRNYNVWDTISIFVATVLLGGIKVDRPNLTETTTITTRIYQRNLYIFSILFTLNIAIGNVSLQYVSINFNQVIRSLIPGITMILSIVLYNKSYTIQRQLTIVPIIIGVAMSCYGDRMYYTYIGLYYTIACSILASIKVIASSELLTSTSTNSGNGNSTSISLHPVDLLYRMAPLAFIQCCLLSLCTGEVSSLFLLLSTSSVSISNNSTVLLSTISVLVLSGILAFTLNITSLIAYKVTSPLTCCIVAAVKQVLTIAFSTIVFVTPITLLNGCGIIIVLVASTYYSYIAIIESTTSSNSSTSNSTSTEKNNTKQILITDDNDDTTVDSTTSTISNSSSTSTFAIAENNNSSTGSNIMNEEHVELLVSSSTIIKTKTISPVRRQTSMTTTKTNTNNGTTVLPSWR